MTWLGEQLQAWSEESERDWSEYERAVADGYVVGAPLLEETAATVVEPEWLTTEEAARKLGIDRDTLDKMVSRAPKSLPGSPTHVGKGKVRRHLRWSAARLFDWASGYDAWERTRGRAR